MPGARPTKWMIRTDKSADGIEDRYDREKWPCFKHSEATSFSAATPPSIFIVEVEAWIELYLFHLAPTPPWTPKVRPSCEQVEERLVQDAEWIEDRYLGIVGDEGDTTTDGDTKTKITTLSKHLADAGPGLRERVRRAARRLFILPKENWACRDYLGAHDEDERNDGLDLYQNGKLLNGLEGASFAKGPIQFQLRRSGK